MSASDEMTMKERNEKICEDYRDGYSISQVAKRYGISTTWVLALLRKNNIKTRPAGNPHNKKKDA
ncbi:MAG: hypothetical protein EOM21_18575 [Gammaproteobacteria bacterium]|nr:hypothetical protein [Gammaproteobacteria bacterium]